MQRPPAVVIVNVIVIVHEMAANANLAGFFILRDPDTLGREDSISCELSALIAFLACVNCFASAP
jgi:hypothetical protein